jgi:hypothetical protein
VYCGLALYLVVAGLLEARALPAERVLARALVETPDDVVAAAAAFARALDQVLVVLTALFVVMVVQF